jgi:hypothetical protein
MGAFDHQRSSKPAPRQNKNHPIFCVGWRAFMNWPQSPGGVPRPVPLTDASGLPLANDLVDGEEVEILAWKPRSREGIAYQVRRLSDGTEWWVSAPLLRRLRA